MRTLPLVLALAMLPIIAPAEDSAAPSGIEGVITISPVHGGPARVGASDSKPLAKTDFVVMDGEKVVASFTTNDDGTFHIALPPGHYSVSLKGGRKAIGRYGPFDVVVTAGEITKVEWNCDSGMR